MLLLKLTNLIYASLFAVPRRGYSVVQRFAIELRSHFNNPAPAVPYVLAPARVSSGDS